jgi:hypothetical protein
MSDPTLNAQDRYEDRSVKEAEAILRNVMHRQRWCITVRDELALRLRIFANERHLELSSERRKK